MNKRDIQRGLWNIFYSFKATSFRNLGYPKILPRTVWIALTYKCNSRCKMCGIWKKYKKNPELAKNELTFSEFKEFIDKNRFIKDITLSGGEPFLVPELEKMYLYIDSKGYHTGTATNAILKDKIIKTEESLLKKLSGKNFHGLTISIDGLEKEHDRIRGIKGLFNNALELVKWGLEKQKEYKFFNINVSHTITSHNYDKLGEFIDFFSKAGLKPEQI
ncbi:MAG: radical SAM protein, partial [Candidatus Pacearchaeota archaeon]|nr:radical SAM protein [Candidatus Pacearchaeota archaeon]